MRHVSSATRKIAIRKMQYEKNAIWKKSSLTKVPQKKSATRKKCNIRKVQREKYAAWKKWQE